MKFDEAVKGLRSEEIEALKVLEASGWQVGLDVRVEDMTKPDGERRRTFSNRGRYAVAVFLKNLGGRDRVEFPAFASEHIKGMKPIEIVPEVVIQKPVEEKSETVLVEQKEIAKPPLAWAEPVVDAKSKASPKLKKGKVR